jgi:hypothetical protein
MGMRGQGHGMAQMSSRFDSAYHALRLPQYVPQWLGQALVNEIDHLLLFLNPAGQRVGTIE